MKRNPFDPEIALNPRRVDRALGCFMQLKAPYTDAEWIEEVLTLLLRGLSNSALILPVGSRLFRSRRLGPGESLPLLRSGFGYPPRPEQVPLGRANRLGQAVFYASRTREAPFFECDLAPGDIVLISRWMVRKELSLNAIALPTPTGNQSKLDRKVQRALATKFAAPLVNGDDSPYRLTSAIAARMMSGEDLAGIVYPALAMPGKSHNVAIKANISDWELALEDAKAFRVRTVLEHTLNIEPIDEAVVDPDGQSVRWLGAPGVWQLTGAGERLHMSLEYGEWVARDSRGELVSTIPRPQTF